MAILPPVYMRGKSVEFVQAVVCMDACHSSICMKRVLEATQVSVKGRGSKMQCTWAQKAVQQGKARRQVQENAKKKKKKILRTSCWVEKKRLHDAFYTSHTARFLGMHGFRLNKSA